MALTLRPPFSWGRENFLDGLITSADFPPQLQILDSTIGFWLNTNECLKTSCHCWNWTVFVVLAWLRDLRPQICLYFQGFCGSKKLSSFTKLLISARNKVIFSIQNRYVWSVILKFSNAFYDSWILVYCPFNSYFTFKTTILCEGKTSLFFNLQFLFLLSERELSPENCLAICHLRASCF